MEVEMLEEFTKYNDQMIHKRKRTKPPRPSLSSSSSAGPGGSRGGGNEFPVSSPTTTTTSTTTEEDEDMANCLILLAQSGSPQEDNKFISKKFTNLSNEAQVGKVGIYVYECKTCNRSFPSFQALGGHRASHKKPKSSNDNVFAMVEEEKKLIINTRVNVTTPSPPSSIQSSSTASCNKSDHMKAKIHECSICGSEFSSGQALGGHMRRHRTAAQNNITPPRIINANDDESEKPRKILALDLNLPAPPEDDRRPDQKFMLFSSPALVDCHY